MSASTLMGVWQIYSKPAFYGRRFYWLVKIFFGDKSLYEWMSDGLLTTKLAWKKFEFHLPWGLTGKILDAGCGPATMTKPAAEKNPNAQIIGVDISPELLELARVWCRGLKARFYLGDIASQLPFLDDGEIDQVISNWAEPYLRLIQQLAMFEEFYRVLKPGGRIVLSTMLKGYSFSQVIKYNLKAEFRHSLRAIIVGMLDLRPKVTVPFDAAQQKGDADYPSEAEIQQMLTSAGFANFRILERIMPVGPDDHAGIIYEAYKPTEN